MSGSEHTQPNHICPDMSEVAGLTAEQRQKYARDGWVVVPSLFTADECDGLIRHMDAVHSGEITVEGIVPPAEGADHLIDADQCHIHDPVCRAFMLHPKLRGPLVDALGGTSPRASRVTTGGRAASGRRTGIVTEPRFRAASVCGFRSWTWTRRLVRLGCRQAATSAARFTTMTSGRESGRAIAHTQATRSWVPG